jgi:hypothetical protein
MKVKSLSVILAAIAISTGPETAYAYLDPGTGSILLQSLIGSVMAGSALLGFYYRRITSRFRRSKSKSSQHG